MTPELFTHLNGDYRERACTPPPETHVEGTEFLHNLVENAFSWGKQDCNYLNPKHIEAFIGATRNGMPPEAAAAWIADGSPAPVSNGQGSNVVPASDRQIALMKDFWSHYGKPPHLRELNASLLKRDFLSLIARLEAPKIATPSPQPRKDTQ